jgi:hypothetical protein
MKTKSDVTVSLLRFTQSFVHKDHFKSGAFHLVCAALAIGSGRWLHAPPIGRLQAHSARVWSASIRRRLSCGVRPTSRFVP